MVTATRVKECMHNPLPRLSCVPTQVGLLW